MYTCVSAILCVATVHVWVRSRSHLSILYFTHDKEQCRAWISGGRVGIDNDPHVVIELAKREHDLRVMETIQGEDLMAPPPSNVPARWSRSSTLLLPSLATMFLGFMIMPTIAGWVLRRARIATQLCVACGYNLTGNTSGTCPECGKPVPSRPR